MSFSETHRFNLVLKKDYYEDGSWWVAHCVEYDIVTQARTPEGALNEFRRTIAARAALANRRGGSLVDGLRPGKAWVREIHDRPGAIVSMPAQDDASGPMQFPMVEARLAP